MVNINSDVPQTYGTYCNSGLVDFPVNGMSSSGAYIHDNIVICGGILTNDQNLTDPSQDCYHWADDQWQIFGQLTVARSDHGKYLDNLRMKGEIIKF